MAVGIPALAGLSVLHGLVPPHPGPLVAIDALGADLGLTLLFGLICRDPDGDHRRPGVRQLHQPPVLDLPAPVVSASASSVGRRGADDVGSVDDLGGRHRRGAAGRWPTRRSPAGPASGWPPRRAPCCCRSC